jgi:TM2 domain-containing membrane protein YozV
MSRWSGLFLVVFSLSMLVSVSGQKIEQLIEYADFQFDQGIYKIAAREYQRALFFGSKEEVGKLNIKTGDCYFEMNSFDEAEKFYRFAAGLEMADSLKNEAILKKSSCNLMLGNYNLGIFDLLNLNAGNLPEIQTKKDVLLAIAYFGLNDFDKSRHYFGISLRGQDSLKRQKLDSLFNSKKLHRPNPELAYWLSVVLPGAGQFYSGDIRNGSNSLLLIATLMTFGIRMAIVQSPADAIFTILPWYQRYYMGGYNSARQIAERKRENNRAKIYKQVFEMVYSKNK